MPRTTLNLDRTVLEELRRRGEAENKSMGQLASELLARVLAEPASVPDEPLRWTAKEMAPRVDLEDRDAVQAVLDSS